MGKSVAAEYQGLNETKEGVVQFLEKLKEESAPKIKLLKAATPAPKAEGAKDEV